MSEDGTPRVCPEGRTALYVAGGLRTALGEVFGDLPAATVCSNYRVALLRPARPITVLDLRGGGAAMRVGALPSLATGAYPRGRTQDWARAIYEDQPCAHRPVRGVYYDAAHTRGPALALWNLAEGEVEVVRDRRGRRQDHALIDDAAWPRVATFLSGLGIRAEMAETCGCG